MSVITQSIMIKRSFPMEIISQVADTMQTVLTETANQLAQETGLIKRQRKLSGASFAQTLVFGWLSNPDATLDELAQTATAIGVEITPEAVFQRFTPDASQFLKRMLDASIEQVISANPVAIEVLKRFSGVYLLDSSIVTLPDELAAVWQGCGGSERNSSASVKLSVCWNMTCGDFSLHIADAHRIKALHWQLNRFLLMLCVSLIWDTFLYQDWRK
jgi:hypothetical protein